MTTQQNLAINASIRHDIGKGASRRLRRAQRLPGVVYGGGKETTSLSFEHKEVVKALQGEAFYSHILTLNIDNEAERVILKDVQRHPYKQQILHIDFQRIRADEKITMNVPLHFIGEANAPGVIAGGLISHLMTDVEISCLPEHLPEYLEADLSNLALNATLHLSDLKLPAHVEVVALSHDNDQAIASIHSPRVEAEPSALEAAPISAEVPASAQKSEANPSKK
jgi:large subunit ribosomal protein L25